MPVRRERRSDHWFSFAGSALLLSFAPLGCTADSHAPESPGDGGTTGDVVSGSVAGVPFGDAQRSLSNVVMGAGGAGVLVIVANEAIACDLSSFANLHTLSLNIGDYSANATPPRAGTYDINRSGASITPGQGMTVAAQFSARDAQCAETEQVDATSGTITLASVSDQSVAGSFDLTFYGGGQLEGSFDAVKCDFSAIAADSAKLDGGPTPCRH